jgi:hypothetical protein
VTDPTADLDGTWREYEFHCKPGALSRRPCVITPWHYRLDWLAWFAGMATYRQYPWTVHLAHQLLNQAQPGAPAAAAAAGKAGAHNQPAATAIAGSGSGSTWWGAVAAQARDLIATDALAGRRPTREFAAPWTAGGGGALV